MKRWKILLVLQLYGLGAVAVVSLTWAVIAVMAMAADMSHLVRDIGDIVEAAALLSFAVGSIAGAVALLYGVPAYFALWRAGLANLFTTSLVALLPALGVLVAGSEAAGLAWMMAAVGLPVAGLLHCTTTHCFGPRSRYHAATEAGPPSIR